ncbi:MAG: MFS transporter [Novosphingobium sp.]|nr:MFS transporter [Novosphingobium sp.]
MAEKRAWLTVVILLLLSIVAYIDRSLISLLVEPIKQDLGLDDFEIGIVQGLGFGLFYALFGIPMGYLVDRFPRRIVIWAGVSAWSLAASACGLATSFTGLMLARFGVGAGEATLSPAAYSIIGDLFPPRKLAFAIALFGIGGVLGVAVSLILGGTIMSLAEQASRELPALASFKPWQLAFIMAGLPGLALAFLAFLIPEPQRRGAAVAAGGQASLSGFLYAHRRLLLCHFIGFGLVATLSYGMMAWAPSFLIRRHGMTIAEAGMYLGAIGALAGVAGHLFNGWIVDRGFQRGIGDMHLRYYAITSLAAGAAAVIGFALPLSPAGFGAAFAVVYFLQPFTGPAAALLQIATPPDYRGRVSALFLLVMNLMGLCIGPALVSAATQFLFADPLRVGESIALMFAVLSPIATAVFWAGLSAARVAVRG